MRLLNERIAIPEDIAERAAWRPFACPFAALGQKIGDRRVDPGLPAITRGDFLAGLALEGQIELGQHDHQRCRTELAPFVRRRAVRILDPAVHERAQGHDLLRPRPDAQQHASDVVFLAVTVKQQGDFAAQEHVLGACRLFKLLQSDPATRSRARKIQQVDVVEKWPCLPAEIQDQFRGERRDHRAVQLRCATAMLDGHLLVGRHQHTLERVDIDNRQRAAGLVGAG